MALELLLMNGGFKSRAIWPIAYQQKPKSRAAPDHFRCGSQQVVVTFQRRKPGDLSDDKIPGSQSEACPERRVICRLEKRLQREATENAGELFRAPDARIEVLAGHRMGDGHEV